jgi:hypothetical protein
MGIDRYALANDLADVRRLAAKKWAEDPLPNGADALRQLQRDIARLALEPNIAQLETDGYTVLAPGKAGPPELIEALKAAMLALEARVSTDNLGASSGLGTTLFHMLPEDQAFEAALMSDVALTLVTYLLGFRAKLSQCTGLIKPSGTPALALHADHSSKFAAPWAAQANYSVVTWVLTDYTRDNGAVCVWPG